MRTSLLAASFLLCPPFLVSADEVPIREGQVVQPKPGPGKPVKVQLVRPKFRLHVQGKPKFPDAQPGEAATSSERGLKVSFQPEKGAFSSRGPISFKVELKNVSEETFMLYDPGSLGRACRVVFSNQKTAAQWTLKGPKGKKTGASHALKPGKTLTYYAVVEWGPRPKPIPLHKQTEEGKEEEDKPADNANPDETDADEDGSSDAGDKAVPRRRHGVRPVFIVPREVPVGAGSCKAMLLIEFSKNPQPKKWAHPHWTGKIATAPVALEIKRTRPRPVPLPRPIPRPRPQRED